MKFYFVIFEGWPGVETALRCVESAIKDMLPEAETKFLNLLSNGRLNIQTISTIQTSPPEYLFLGGWDNNVKTVLLNAPKDKTTSMLLWCSPMTQMELSGEMSRFADVWGLLEEGKLNKLGILLESDAMALGKYNENVLYSPVFMKTQDMDDVSACRLPESNGHVNADLFCAPCPRKNIMSQLIALATLRDKNLMVHTNYNHNYINNQYFTLANRFFRQNMTNHSWMSRDHYLGIVKGMDFGSQITLSESFNYTAAEHMYFGVPVMLSPSSPISKWSHKELDPIIIKKPDDIYEIASVAENLVVDKTFREDMGGKSKECIENINSLNFEALKETLSMLFRGELV